MQHHQIPKYKWPPISVSGGHLMIVGKTPKIFVNATRSLKTVDNRWVEPATVSFDVKLSAEWRDGAIGCTFLGDCYHLKFGGTGWTYAGGPFVGGYRKGGVGFVIRGVYWVLGGAGTLQDWLRVKFQQLSTLIIVSLFSLSSQWNVVYQYL